jgi:hypothetical protein
LLHAASEDCSDESGGERSGHRRRRAKPAAVAPPAAAPAPPAGGDEWDLWASADLEQKLLDEIHTTGGRAGLAGLDVAPLPRCRPHAARCGRSSAGRMQNIPHQAAACRHLQHTSTPKQPHVFRCAGFAASCKTVFVMALLKKLVAGGHRTLVFSQSRVM